MSEQHTPEPWSYQASIPEDGFECFFINGERKRISYFDGPQDDEQFANVRRIVACVNACAGIHTDDLEQCPSGGLFNLVDYSNELVKQRDELLAALESILPEFRQHSLRNLRDDETSENHRCRVFDHDDHLYEIANKVIASVKANTK